MDINADRTETLIQRLARQCLSDFSPLDLKGKALDKAVLTWWLGAHRALWVAGSRPDADWVERVMFFCISTGGYAEVLEIVRKADEVKAEAAKLSA